MRRSSLLMVCLLLLSSCAPAVVRHNAAGNERFANTAYEDAVSEYRLAQVAEPDRPEPYYNAANAYNRMGQLDVTLMQTEQALKTADPLLAAQAWYNLGNAHFDVEQWPQAVEAYKKALRLQPDDLDAKHNLELALRRLQEQQQDQQREQQEQDQQAQGEEQKQDAQDEQQEGQAEATPTPEGESASPAGEEGEENPTPRPLQAPQDDQSMTAEHATQLLRALLGDSQSLQERLREMYQVPAPAPEQDW